MPPRISFGHHRLICSNGLMIFVTTVDLFELHLKGRLVQDKVNSTIARGLMSLQEKSRAFQAVHATGCRRMPGRTSTTLTTCNPHATSDFPRRAPGQISPTKKPPCWRLNSQWCRRGDSNPHGSPHHPLKMACLPNSTTSAWSYGFAASFSAAGAGLAGSEVGAAGGACSVPGAGAVAAGCTPFIIEALPKR